MHPASDAVNAWTGEGPASPALSSTSDEDDEDVEGDAPKATRIVWIADHDHGYRLHVPKDTRQHCEAQAAGGRSRCDRAAAILSGVPAVFVSAAGIFVNFSKPVWAWFFFL